MRTPPMTTAETVGRVLDNATSANVCGDAGDAGDADLRGKCTDSRGSFVFDPAFVSQLESRKSGDTDNVGAHRITTDRVNSRPTSSHPIASDEGDDGSARSAFIRPHPRRSASPLFFPAPTPDP